MKLKNFLNPTMNSRTNQEGGTWRKKELKKIGLTSKQLLEMVFPIPTKPVSKLK